MYLDKMWRITLLGDLRAEMEGGRLITRFQTAKTGSLFAYLAYYPHRVHTREQLMERFWPDGEPNASRLSLRVALASLRRQLEPPGVLFGTVLQTEGNTHVGLNPKAFTTDAAAFHHAVRAYANDAARASPTEKRKRLDEGIALYKGDLLPSLYDDWVVAEREILAQIHHDALHRLQALTHDGTVKVISGNADVPGTPLLPLRLPLQMTRFFGRKKEIAHLIHQIRLAQGASASPRLLTLTGPGGVGKTRLVVEAVREAATTHCPEAAPAFAAYFVPLADLTDVALIVGAIADALHLTITPKASPLDQVAIFLLSCPAFSLLVLDNFEQLIKVGGVPIVQTLLLRIPNLICLVTSRQTLQIAGEREIPLPSLPTPHTLSAGEPRSQEPHTPEQLTPEQLSPPQLLEFPSVQLFLDRAQASRPDFQITPRNAPAINALCRKLEGIPLAIELAAARTSVLAPAQMLQRLEQGFDALQSRRPDLPARHQTLRATMEWSYQLLEPELKPFFVCFAVFRGGWTVEAAEAVCEPTNWLAALEALEQLRKRSLVIAEEADEKGNETAIRFRLLETLREFASDCLTPEARLDVEYRHAQFYVALAETAEAHLRGTEQAVWLKRLEAEQDNFRSVRQWALASDTRAEYGLRLAGALWRFWMMRGYFQEGRAWLENALARGNTCSPAVRAKALNGLAGLASYQHDYVHARPLYEECLRLQKEAGNNQGIAAALNNLGLVATAQGDYQTARALCQQSLALRIENDDRHGIATALGNLGNIALFQEDYVSAQSFQEQSLRLFRELGATQSVALTLNASGATALGQENHESARARFEECFGLYQELGDARGIAEAQHNLCAVFGQQGDTKAAWACNEQSLVLRQQIGSEEGMVACLESFAGLLTQTGFWTRACRLFGAADALRSALGTPLTPFTRRIQERHVSETQTMLGEKNFNQHWHEGRALTLEQAVALVHEPMPGFETLL